MAMQITEHNAPIQVPNLKTTPAMATARVQTGRLGMGQKLGEEKKKIWLFPFKINVCGRGTDEGKMVFHNALQSCPGKSMF